jgi:hypothetical protein
MSDGVLAAIIAACATVFTSFIQIRASFAKEGASRALSGSGSRKKSRAPLALMFLMLGGAAVGGFALAQWITERERSMQDALMAELQARVASLTRSESELVESRAGTRAEIEAGVHRKIGLEGVVATTTIGPCKPPLMMNTPALAAHSTEGPAPMTAQPTTSAQPATSCTEAEATPITLCAIVPVGATVTEVEVFMRASDSDAPWSTARLVPGAETDQARFSEKPVEVADGAHTKQVCETFTSWSTERARTARMLVRYSL